MKHLYQALFVLLLFSCTEPTSSEPVSITKEDESTIKEIQVSLLQKAYDEQDTTLLGQLYHSDFQLVDDNGDTYSKSDEMEYVSNYGPTHNEAGFEILNLNILANGTAVIFGKGTLKGVQGNEAYITTFKATNVLVKEGGSWKMISSHISGVKEDRFPMAPEE